MPRISIPISEELQERLQKTFPWGTQAPAIRRLIELMIDKMEKDHYNVVHLLLSGKYNPLEEFENSEKEKEKKGTKS